jgi:hypothetical protein
MLKEKLKTMPKKKIAGLIVLAILAVLLWQISIPVIAVWAIFKKTKIKTPYKWLTSILLVIIYVSIMGVVYGKKSDNKINMASGPATTSNFEENNTPKNNPVVKDTDLVSRIEGKAEELGASSITVSNSDNSDVASSNTKPPYNVVVIYKNNGSVNDCFTAKEALMETMKSIYGDEALAGKILNIKFLASPSIDASLGYDQAKDVDWSKVGKEIGPSIFWNNLNKEIVEPSGFGQQSDMWGYTANGCK